ncbi:MAG: YicC family protein [Lachnospiraceae bacterium]|nr:YicC family protein [Lachnospiraceae bacterium]
MIRSMTGFGRYEASDDTHKILVEIKAVDHRYLDFNIKMPKKFCVFESRIRRVMKEYAVRGKLDIFISCEDFTDSQMCIRYNRTLAGEYMKYFREMQEEFGIQDDITVSRLASFPDVLVMEHQEEDEESLWPLLEQAVRGAGESFAAQRSREGGQLREDILVKLSGMEDLVSQVETCSPQVVEEYRKRLEEKVRELLDTTEIDEARLMTEVAIFADKTCVDEETVRLRSHIAGMRKTLNEAGEDSVGRKLDFLAQEMNREANTILSKCSNMDISSTAIQIKTEIEKIREQVQNIE